MLVDLVTIFPEFFRGPLDFGILRRASGDYVLRGGESGAGVIVDTVTGLIPGALGNEASTQQESFTASPGVPAGDAPSSTCVSGGLLDYPHYTRPAEFRGMAVPEVLVGGNHEQIRKWRRGKTLEKTLHNRPDLLERQPLSEEDRKFLADIDKKKAGKKKKIGRE